MKKFLKDNATLIALILMMIALAFMSDVFFTARNLSNLTRQVTIIGIIAIGMTMVILLGGIDLSVGSVVGLSAITVTMFMESGLPNWLAIILTLLLTGVAIGAWNGFWIAKYKIPPFIITLGMMTIARGLAMVISGGGSVPVTDAFFPKIGGAYISPSISTILLLIALGLAVWSVFAGVQKKKKYGVSESAISIIGKIVTRVLGVLFAVYVFAGYKGIPIPVLIFIVLIGISVFVLKHTTFGRGIYAAGGNEEAARLSGLNIFKINMSVFMIISTLSALAGIILASRLNGASPSLGNMFELDAIASVVIGGTSLSGGSGSIVGTIIGTLIIGVLNNGMSLMNVSMFYQLIVKGFIIILAVWFDVMNKSKKGAK